MPSTFDTDPPIGYSAFAFDIPPVVLTGTEPLPPVPLTGATPTTLAKLGDQPMLLLAFVDEPMPEGLVLSLKRLSSKTPVACIALKNAKVDVGGFPLYRSNDSGFDRAGIRATPQFYLVGSGKVIQAWSGFLAKDSAKFEEDVLTYAVKR